MIDGVGTGRLGDRRRARDRARLRAGPGRGRLRPRGPLLAAFPPGTGGMISTQGVQRMRDGWLGRIATLGALLMALAAASPSAAAPAAGDDWAKATAASEAR